MLCLVSAAAAVTQTVFLYSFCVQLFLSLKSITVIMFKVEENDYVHDPHILCTAKIHLKTEITSTHRIYE